MSTRTKKYKQIVNNLTSKEYRDLYVENHITNGIAFQIHSMRDSRKWTQKKLAESIGTKQGVVSRLENPNYGKYSLDTLKKVAASFDVALLVSFVPFSELVARTTSLTNRCMDVPSYEDDEQLNNFSDHHNVQYIDEDFVKKASINIKSISISNDTSEYVENYG